MSRIGEKTVNQLGANETEIPTIVENTINQLEANKAEVRSEDELQNVEEIEIEIMEF